MKQVIYKRKQSIENRRKAISINEHTCEKECATHVRKSFAYIVTPCSPARTGFSKPDVFIKKTFDSKTKTEKFAFKVKGFFYMSHARQIVKVDFCHTLRINIKWKNKIFSPKKSVTLT